MLGVRAEVVLLIRADRPDFVDFVFAESHGAEAIETDGGGERYEEREDGKA
jgi:hypothetical protein